VWRRGWNSGKRKENMLCVARGRKGVREKGEKGRRRVKICP